MFKGLDYLIKFTGDTGLGYKHTSAFVSTSHWMKNMLFLWVKLKIVIINGGPNSFPLEKFSRKNDNLILNRQQWISWFIKLNKLKFLFNHFHPFNSVNWSISHRNRLTISNINRLLWIFSCLEIKFFSFVKCLELYKRIFYDCEKMDTLFYNHDLYYFILK